MPCFAFSADGLAVCEKVVHSRTLLTVFNEAKVTASIPIWPVSFAHSHRLGCSLIIASRLSPWVEGWWVRQIIIPGTQLQVRHMAGKRPRKTVARPTQGLLLLNIHGITIS